MKILGRFLPALLAALVSGGAMILLFPPFHLPWLVWLIFVPVLLALWSQPPKRRRRRSFLIGWAMGAAGFIGIFSWLLTVTWAGWLAVSIYLGLFPAIWAAFTATLADPRRDPKGNTWSGAVRRSFWVAAMWCGTEWLRGWLFTGFGWNDIGVAFHQTPLFAQAADLFGIAGLSFVPVFVQSIAVQALMRQRSGDERVKGKPLYDLAVAMLLVTAVVGYGRWRISSYGKQEAVRLKALMVQLNIPQTAGKREMAPEEVHMNYEDETLGAFESLPANKRPDWVIWPEGALSGWLLRMPDNSTTMARQNVDTLQTIHEGTGDFTTIMGLSEVEAERMGDQVVMKKDAKFWNSMVVLPAKGGVETFRKHHLVIFGEYIPFIEQLPWLAKIYEQQANGEKYGGSFARGEGFEPLPADVGSNQVQIIPTVCFEDSVGRLVRKFTRDAPQVIVNVTDDGWFQQSIGAEQHFANARFRAIELRRPLIRCANTGVTAAVDTLGLTLSPAQSGVHQELRDTDGKTFLRGHLLTEVDIPKHPVSTLYAAIGDWGVIAGALLSFFWAWLYARIHREIGPEPVEFFG